METLKLGWALPGDIARALARNPGALVRDREAMGRVWWSLYGYWIMRAEFERAGIHLPGPELSREVPEPFSGGEPLPVSRRIPWAALFNSRLWNLLGPIDPAPFDLSDRAMMFALTAGTGSKGGFEQMNEAGLAALAEKLREVADRIAVQGD
jgi:hypothetical protein